VFRNNQQTYQFLSIYYFTLLLLHVSATVYHPQGARLHLLSYVPVWVCIRTRPQNNIHITTYYTEFYQPKPKLACRCRLICGLGYPDAPRPYATGPLCTALSSFRQLQRRSTSHKHQRPVSEKWPTNFACDPTSM
jgi:hypothetical protein